MYAATASALKYEMFGYLPGGYARMLAAFRQRLEALGVEIQTGCRVQQVEQDEQGRLVVTAAGRDPLGFDRVVLTAPRPVAARMCGQLTENEVERCWTSNISASCARRCCCPSRCRRITSPT